MATENGKVIEPDIVALVNRLNLLCYDPDPRLNLHPALLGYMMRAAEAYRDCLGANSWRERLLAVARAERALGQAETLAAWLGLGPDYLDALRDDGARVLSIAGNVRAVSKRFERIG